MAEYFFHKLDQLKGQTAFLKVVQDFANDNKKQIYAIASPLTDNKYRYQYNGGYILLVPKRKIAFVRIDGDIEDFNEYVDDVLDDIASLADKYQFKEIIGRRRKWERMIERFENEPQCSNFESLYSGDLVLGHDDFRTLDILISLFIGSINDATKVTTEEPDNILDKVKKKIQLFDTDQSRFIYDELPSEQKVIRIQGLSGTGKTELLLHKLKDLYLQDKGSKICITCHNKVLADSLSKRIPRFFDFMKVEKQIEWNKRLWCNNAWGRAGDENSGAFRYICYYYEIPFLSLREAGSFKRACEIATKKILAKREAEEEFSYAFTFMFVDESQDFDSSFFKLCELVTEKRVYIAGDIFQSIFDSQVDANIKSDYLLSRCYRTDPKTLMFAQGLGMGLFEAQKLWWLEEDMWKLCGYNVQVKGNGMIFELSREPIRRFEDVSSDFDSLKIFKTSKIVGTILTLVAKLKEEFPNILPSDIGIIYIDNDDYVYESAPKLGAAFQKSFGWEYNLAHESKIDAPETVFISNRNNVKGLEFPFVFCITKSIVRDYSYRNTIYTMLSRSFLRSYLIVEQNENDGLTEEIIEGAKNIMQEKSMTIMVPSTEEKLKIRHEFSIASRQKSLRDRVEDIMKANSIPLSRFESLLSMVSLLGGNQKSDSTLAEFIINTNKAMNE